MDKREYLNRLQMQLSDLTNEERREALEYYEEYFADAGEENEEEVILSLGTPEQVAEQIKAGLHKEENGMFTENGYREKIESDNPPEVYGKQAEQQKNRGPLPWGREKQKKTGYQNASDGYAQSSNNYRGGYGNGYFANGQRSEGYHTDGRDANGYNANGYHGSRAQAGKKKEGMSGGMIALIVILCIFASPVILGLGAGLFGVILGLLGAVLAVIVAFCAVVVAFLAAGIGLFIGGFPLLFVTPFGGMICISVGCFLLALFLLCLLLLVTIFSKFFPWLIREVESLGKYVSRKWSERKRGRETV